LEPQAQAQSQRYSDLMDASQNFVIAEVLDSYHFSSHRCVLDIGCGKGRFAVALAQRLPHLNLQVLDLPHVMALTRERLQSCGLLGRTQCFARSFLGEPLPRGADLVTLVRVAHDHSDAVLGQLLRQIWQALPAGGKLLLAEPMALADEVASGSKEADPYFHFYMLAMGEGRLRSPEELTSMLRAAGFDEVRRLPTAMPIHAQALLATKSSVYPGFSHLGVNSD
jgi:demethylspheroidene O-methyltransferase